MRPRNPMTGKKKNKTILIIVAALVFSAAGVYGYIKYLPEGAQEARHRHRVCQHGEHLLQAVQIPQGHRFFEKGTGSFHPIRRQAEPAGGGSMVLPGFYLRQAGRGENGPRPLQEQPQHSSEAGQRHRSNG